MQMEEEGQEVNAVKRQYIWHWHTVNMFQLNNENNIIFQINSFVNPNIFYHEHMTKKKPPESKTPFQK